MSELDKRLKQIVVDDVIVSAIRQSFIEDGWGKVIHDGTGIDKAAKKASGINQ